MSDLEKQSGRRPRGFNLDSTEAGKVKGFYEELPLELEDKCATVQQYVREWDSDRLIERGVSQRTLRIFPYLRSVLALFARNQRKFSEPSGIPLSDVWRHLLQEDLYMNGLHTPLPDKHRLNSLIDWMYFPSAVKELAGEKFDDLVELWSIMCRNGDRTLYRHSFTAFETNSPCWDDPELVVKIGVKLAKMAYSYGDDPDAIHLLDFLNEPIKAIAVEKKNLSEKRIKLLRLRIQCKADPGEYEDHLHDFVDLFESCDRSSNPPDLMTEYSRFAHEICRSFFRAAAHFSIFCQAQGKIPFVTGHKLYSNMLESYLKQVESDFWSVHDMDTVIRLYVLVYPAVSHMSRADAIAFARKMQQEYETTVESEKSLQQGTIDRILSDIDLNIWTHKIDRARIHPERVYQYWQYQTDAICQVAESWLAVDGNQKAMAVQKARSHLDLLNKSVLPKNLRHHRTLTSLLEQLAGGT